MELPKLSRAQVELHDLEARRGAEQGRHMRLRPAHATVGVETDSRGAVSAIDLRLPADVLANTTSPSSFIRQANALLERTLTSLDNAGGDREEQGSYRAGEARADHAAFPTLPSRRSLKLLQSHTEHKAFFDEATAELMGAIKSVAHIYDPPAIPEPVLPSLPVARSNGALLTGLERALGSGSPKRQGAHHLPGLPARATDGVTDERGESTPPVPRDSTRRQVRAKLAFLRSDEAARRLFCSQIGACTRSAQAATPPSAALSLRSPRTQARCCRVREFQCCRMLQARCCRLLQAQCCSMLRTQTATCTRRDTALLTKPTPPPMLTQPHPVFCATLPFSAHPTAHTHPASPLALRARRGRPPRTRR